MGAASAEVTMTAIIHLILSMRPAGALNPEKGFLQNSGF